MNVNRTFLLLPLLSGMLLACGTATTGVTPTPGPSNTYTPDPNFTQLRTPLAPDAFLQEDTLMLDRINAARAAGANCPNTSGGTTAFPAAPPVKLEGHLQRAAILHARDMIRRSYQAHIAPDPAPNGAAPVDRILNAGYRPPTGLDINENLAFVTGTPSNADIDIIVNAWLNSHSGHCQAMMNARSVDIGIWQENGTWVTEYGNPL